MRAWGILDVKKVGMLWPKACAVIYVYLEWAMVKRTWMLWGLAL